MNLHEYQAKVLFTEYGMPVPAGEVASNAEEALMLAKKLTKTTGCTEWVVKAQVHAGGRGKGGGVKFATSHDAVAEATTNMLGRRLVTYQTDAKGLPVNQVLIAEPTDIARELYLGAVVDRATQRVVMMASTEGGVDIEHVAETQPEKILQIMVDPLVGLLPYQCREIGFAFGLNQEQIRELTHIMISLYRLFVEEDLSLVEINPLVVKKDGHLTCLDGKVNIDDNALYRHPDLRAMRDTSQEDERENRAHNWELNYIALDGDIGCMVNGAGLAMATMDLIKLHGGNPANFLDVGGGATKERVTEAFKIILSDENVKGVLINIFGGIVRCDMIAEGIMSAVAEVGVKIPVVVRLEGNNAEIAGKMLADSGLNIIAASGFDDAARRIVAAVK